MLQPIAGTGDFVEGQKHVFGLEAGMTAEVEDSVGAKWIASGIAEREEPEARTTPEIASVETPETAALKRPVARKGRRA